MNRKNIHLNYYIKSNKIESRFNSADKKLIGEVFNNINVANKTVLSYDLDEFDTDHLYNLPLKDVSELLYGKHASQSSLLIKKGNDEINKYFQVIPVLHLTPKLK